MVAEAAAASFTVSFIAPGSNWTRWPAADPKKLRVAPARSPVVVEVFKVWNDGEEAAAAAVCCSRAICSTRRMTPPRSPP